MRLFRAREKSGERLTFEEVSLPRPSDVGGRRFLRSSRKRDGVLRWRDVLRENASGVIQTVQTAIQALCETGVERTYAEGGAEMIDANSKDGH
jgi:hypothetical protein